MGENNGNNMRSMKIKQILKETPLKIRLQVGNEMAFISLLTELGFREDKMWEESENELLSKLMKSASEHTENQLKTIKKWQKDESEIE